MDQLQELLREIEALSFKEKMQLTTRLLETYLKELPEQTGTDADPWNDGLDRALDQFKRSIEKGAASSDKIAEGFSNLDDLTGGLFKGTLTVVGGRPATGKTTFLLNLARRLMQNGASIGFVSLGQNLERLARGMLQLYSGGPAHRSKIIKSTANKLEALENSWSLLKAQPFYPFYLDDIYTDIGKVLEVCRSAVTDRGAQVIMIDYLQLIGTSNDPTLRRDVQSRVVIKELKRFARQYEVAVVVTSSLSREADLRAGAKEPLMSDLVGSDMIEELADDVLLIYRPYYYGIIEDTDGRDTRNFTSLIVAKNKAGQSRDVHFRFNSKNLEWVPLK